VLLETALLLVEGALADLAGALKAIDGNGHARDPLAPHVRDPALQGARRGRAAAGYEESGQ